MTSLATPFNDGLRAGVVRFQSCAACGHAQTLARYACQRCGHERLDWRDAAGTARVPEDILPLVRPKVDTQSGELWLFNGGVDQVELTWRNGAGEETRESVPAGAIVRRELN